MKFQLLSAVLASVMVTGAVAQTTPAKPATATSNAPIDKATLAYALGFEFGRNLSDQAPGLDVNAISRAMQDGYAKKQPTIAPEKLQATVEAFQKSNQMLLLQPIRLSQVLLLYQVVFNIKLLKLALARNQMLIAQLNLISLVL